MIVCQAATAPLQSCSLATQKAAECFFFTRATTSVIPSSFSPADPLGAAADFNPVFSLFLFLFFSAALGFEGVSPSLRSESEEQDDRLDPVLRPVLSEEPQVRQDHS